MHAFVQLKIMTCTTKAFKLFEVDPDLPPISFSVLKKRYHRMALLHHPDKNGNTTESTEKFKEINESFHLLKNTFYADNDNDNDNDGDGDDKTENAAEKEKGKVDYFDILKLFMKETLDNGKYNDVFVNSVKEIVSNMSFNLLADLDKDNSINMYMFLSKYKNVFHLSTNILEKIRDIVIEKFANVEIYKLNPTINDLLNNNFYKLHIDETLYLVPLWKYESYFDSSCCEIVVLCEPELPEGMKIDDDNNLYIKKTIHVQTDLSAMLHATFMSVCIGDQTHNIPLDQLQLKKVQYVRLPNQGLTRPDNCLFNVSDKADIIVKIEMV